MSGDNVRLLPIWKKGSSIEEWFGEMAMVARKYPERFKRVVVIYEETSPDQAGSICDFYCHGVTTVELMGLIEIGKLKVYDQTHRS